MRATYLFSLMFAIAATPLAAKEPIWTDGKFYVYEELNSCALYADYGRETSLLGLSFKGSTGQVFFGFYSDSFSRMPIGETMSIGFATEDDPKRMLGYMATIVDNRGRKGLAGATDTRLFDYLQGAKTLQIFGPKMLPIASLDTAGIDDAIKRTRRCGGEK